MVQELVDYHATMLVWGAALLRIRDAYNLRTLSSRTLAMRVSMVRDAADPVVGAQPVRWADVLHVSPVTFRPGEPLDLHVQLHGERAGDVERVMLRYRPMNQALPFEGREMERSGGRFVGSVPAGRTWRDNRIPWCVPRAGDASSGRA